ncbi:sensor histidine kinase [Nocardioides zeicaulis]|uniref:sensor histidine kinase n=1 Tax=Nocardioides zeicaulis TaxID=1776857 RepID=UPI0039F12DF2
MTTVLKSVADPSAEIALLQRQLERERRARRMAEEVGERSTSQLYETVQELRHAQGQLRQHLEDQQLVHQLSLDLRRDLDPQGIMRRAVTSVGAAVEADRCLVRFADGSGIGRIAEQWSAPDVPPVTSGTTLPPELARLSLAAADEHTTLLVDDVLADPRLSSEGAGQVVDALGALSYLGTPMRIGDRLIGWLVLHATTHAAPWSARQLAVVEGVADALGIALMQAETHAHQTEALERLRAVDQVKTEFVSTVSHELRTPVTSISGYAQLLLDPEVSELSEDQERMVSVVSRNADRLLNLIEDLLSLSRADAGDLSLPPGTVDLLAVLDDVRAGVVPLARRRGIDLVVDGDEHLPRIPGNPDALERVVFNLLSNALKFSADGSGVTVTLRQQDAGVVLTVRDTGIGIPEADLPLVFDRFHRSPLAVERAIQGTGLGLSVVRSTVELHGGNVSIDSRVGEGTEVRVWLPLDDGVDDGVDG